MSVLPSWELNQIYYIGGFLLKKYKETFRNEAFSINFKFENILLLKLIFILHYIICF